VVARRQRDLDRALERALTEPKLLDRLRGHIRSVRRPEASRHVASLVLERLPA
jgi:hypothetical protein